MNSVSIFLGQALPQLCSEQRDSLGFSIDLQQLYADIVAHRNTRKRKLCEEQLASEEPDLTPSLGLFHTLEV